MGIGAALVMPGTLSTITSVFPPEERAKAVGIWAGFAGTGGTLGLLAVGRAARGVLLGLDLPRHRRARGRRARRRDPRRARPPSRASTSASTRSARCSPRSASALLVLGIIEGPEQGWTSAADARRAGRRRRAARRVRALRAAHARHRCSTRGSSAIAASPPGRRRCSCSSSPCSGSSSCRCSSSSSCSATARSRPRWRCCRCRWSSCRCRRSPGPSPERFGHKLVGGAGLAVSALGLRPVRHARHRQRLPGRSSSPRSSSVSAPPLGDDAGDERDRRVAPARQAGRGVGGQRHRPRARRRVRRRRARQRVQHRLPPRHRRPPRRSARPSSPTQAREAPAIALSDRPRVARRLGARARGAAGLRHRHALRPARSVSPC